MSRDLVSFDGGKTWLEAIPKIEEIAGGAKYTLTYKPATEATDPLESDKVTSEPPSSQKASSDD